MTIIEQTVVGKKSPETCEDGIVVTNSHVAVIDGSTSKSPRQLSQDMRNGRLAMTLIKAFISDMPADISCDTFCEDVSLFFQDYYRRCHADIDRLVHHPEERLCASAVVYSVERRELWMVGDCQCMVNGILYENNKPDEQRYALRRAAFIRKAISQGAPPSDFTFSDSGRASILPDLIASMSKQNIAYAVIDGFPIYREGIRILTLRENGKTVSDEIVLASDGYPFLEPTLAASEERLSQQLRDDPLNINTFVATKGLMRGNCSFDDRAYIRFCQ